MTPFHPLILARPTNGIESDSWSKMMIWLVPLIYFQSVQEIEAERIGELHAFLKQDVRVQNPTTSSTCQQISEKSLCLAPDSRAHQLAQIEKFAHCSQPTATTTPPPPNDNPQSRHHAGWCHSSRCPFGQVHRSLRRLPETSRQTANSRSVSRIQSPKMKRGGSIHVANGYENT